MSNESQLTILQCIRRARQLTRRDLSSALGLGMSMVSKLTTELIERGLLIEIGRSSGNGSGRPSDLLALNPKAGYTVGLDVGGNHLRAAVVDFCGNKVARVDGPGPKMDSRVRILDGLELAIDAVLTQAGLARLDVQGVGIGLFGSVDPSTGSVYSWTETPGYYQVWHDFNLREGLLDRWQLAHIYVDDVVRTLGIAEVLYGRTSARREDFLFVLADTGIGAALMIDRRPYVGPSQLAGELGHIPIGNEPIPCSCGNVGCLETVASIGAVVDRVQGRLISSPVESPLAGLTRKVDIHDIITAAQQGDTLAFRVLTEAGSHLGRGIAIALNLFGAKRVVMGGLLASSPVYFESALQSVRLNTLGKVSQALEFERSELEDDAAARGAASIVLNALFEPGDHNALTLMLDKRVSVQLG